MNPYKIIYNQLIKKAQSRQRPLGYVEKHHIIPKCVGGDNSKENKVALTAKEHYLAHKWLAKIYPDNYKIVLAWISMAFVQANNQQRYKVSAEEYEKLKIELSLCSKVRWESLEYRKSYLSQIVSIGKNNLGTKATKETRKRLSESLKGRKVTEETREKLRKIHTGRKFTEEHKNKLSEAHKGIVFSEQTREKFKIAQQLRRKREKEQGLIKKFKQAA